jgi:endonuclease-3
MASGKVRSGKRAFDIDDALTRVREAIAPFPRAALFELASEGHDSVFEQLVACMISIRTLDEVTIQVARRLFATARDPATLAALNVDEIDRLIHPCTFHGAKAAQIRDIAVKAVDQHGGRLPCDRETLLGFRGVGPKCANLVLGIACNQPHIGVDIHVHRVVNRWGYVETPTPEKTMEALQQGLPRAYWIEINSLLVPFGKHVCTGRSPKCSTCPVLDMCRQVGVTTHR